MQRATKAVLPQLAAALFLVRAHLRGDCSDRVVPSEARVVVVDLAQQDQHLVKPNQDLAQHREGFSGGARALEAQVVSVNPARLRLVALGLGNRVVDFLVNPPVDSVRNLGARLERAAADLAQLLGSVLVQPVSALAGLVLAPERQGLAPGEAVLARERVDLEQAVVDLDPLADSGGPGLELQTRNQVETCSGSQTLAVLSVHNPRNHYSDLNHKAVPVSSEVRRLQPAAPFLALKLLQTCSAERSRVISSVEAPNRSRVCLGLTLRRKSRCLALVHQREVFRRLD